MITVFTPTYNRAFIIENLYKSLCQQTCQDFEWLIVDDGSSDDTEELVSSWIKEDRILIRYFKQKNGGKHRAINKGVSLAQGELFFIVDSDDYLADYAIAFLVEKFNEIESDNSFAGISGVRTYSNGEKIGGEELWSCINDTAINIRSKHHVCGDLAEAYKTSVLKNFVFPDFSNEKFCTEALVWNRIAESGLKLSYLYEKIYICEYLEGGLTSSSIRIRMKSPLATTTYYSEVLSGKHSMVSKIKAGINFWRFYFCLNEKRNFSLSKVHLLYSWLIILGFGMHLNDLRLIRK